MTTIRVKTIAATLSLLWWSIVLESIPKISGDLQLGLDNFSVRSYEGFLTDIRKALPYSGDKDGIKLLSKSPSKDQRFLLVTLEVDKSTAVTFALRTIDLYVIGYRVDKQAWFFSDTSADEKKNLFLQAKHNDLTFKSTYRELENGGEARQKIKLGVQVLKEAATFIATNPAGGKKDEVKKRSVMFLVVIQMVSEATRFKYIEREMKKNGDGGKQRPTSKMLEYENGWNSDAVRGAILKAAPGHVPKTLKEDVYLIKP